MVLDLIIKNPHLHGRWLNTLSFLENCGARMIAAAEHPTLVKEEMLKHAAEEFRHALHLKQQLARIGESYEDYRPLLGGFSSYRYLKRLDLETSRYLKTLICPNRSPIFSSPTQSNSGPLNSTRSTNRP